MCTFFIFYRVVKVGCQYDGDCPTMLACFDGQCRNPCAEGEPCGINAQCRVVDTLPVRTMVCECIPGYRGNAAIKCDLRKRLNTNVAKLTELTNHGLCK